MASIQWEAPMSRIDTPEYFNAFVQDLNAKLLSMPGIVRNTTIAGQLNLGAIPVLGIPAYSAEILHAPLIYELNFTKPESVNSYDWIPKIYMKITFGKHRLTQGTNTNDSMPTYIEIGHEISSAGVINNAVKFNTIRSPVQAISTTTTFTYTKDYNLSHIVKNDSEFVMIVNPMHKQYASGAGGIPRHSAAAFVVLSHNGDNYSFAYHNYTRSDVSASVGATIISNQSIKQQPYDTNSAQPVIGGMSFTGVVDGEVQYRNFYATQYNGNIVKFKNMLLYRTTAMSAGSVAVLVNGKNYLHVGEMVGGGLDTQNNVKYAVKIED